MPFFDDAISRAAGTWRELLNQFPSGSLYPQPDRLPNTGFQRSGSMISPSPGGSALPIAPAPGGSALPLFPSGAWSSGFVTDSSLVDISAARLAERAWRERGNDLWRSLFSDLIGSGTGADVRMPGTGVPAEAATRSGVDLQATGRDRSVISFAMQAIGTPYIWGGADLNGFDCSGLVLWAYAQAGIDMPRTAQEQYHATTRVSQPRPGDLVFFSGDGSGRITHVAIYIGNGQIIDAPSEGTSVRVTPITGWYQDTFVGYGRVGR